MKQWMSFCLIITAINCKKYTREPCAEQLVNYKKSLKGKSHIQTGSGAPVSDITSCLTLGPKGPILLQDTLMLELLSKFNREYIPPRSNQGKGSGAFGYFEVTNDITRYTKAVIFKKVGKRTKIAVRFSVVDSAPGSPDTIRSYRGFSVKCYTEDGIYDMTGFDFPVLFTRDVMALMHLVHASGRNPKTNMLDSNMRWDYYTYHPESMYTTLLAFGEIGIPDGFRHMNGYSITTYKFVNKDGEAVYVRYQFKTDQGLKGLSSEEAARLVATDPDYYGRDLYNAIARGNYPSWTLYIQVMTFEQAEKYKYNPFDSARPWSEEDYPLIEVGKIVLKKNPNNYFADVEQIACSPANMIPGIEPSPDKLLHGRLLAYPDAQRYRLGTNYLELPINRPFKHCVANYERDGQGSVCSHGGAPIYYPNSFGGPENDPRGALSSFLISGDVAKYNNSEDDDTLDLATSYWNSMSEKHKHDLVENLVGSFKYVAGFVQERGLKLFDQVSHEFYRMVKRSLRKALSKLSDDEVKLSVIHD